MPEAKTHIAIFDGQLTRVGASSSFPTTIEEAMYIKGNNSGLEDGEIYYNTTSETMGFYIGSSWIYLGFTKTT